MRGWGWIVSLMVVALGVTFAFLNAAPVTLNYYMGAVQLPMALLLIGALMMGFIAGWITAFLRAWPTKRALKQLKKDHSLLKEELNNMRTMPLETL